MRGLGFAALGIAIVSLVIWVVAWTLFNFVMPQTGAVPRYIPTTLDFVGKFGTFIAVILLAVGMILGGKKTAPPPTV